MMPDIIKGKSAAAWGIATMLLNIQDWYEAKKGIVRADPAVVHSKKKKKKKAPSPRVDDFEAPVADGARVPEAPVSSNPIIEESKNAAGVPETIEEEKMQPMSRSDVEEDDMQPLPRSNVPQPETLAEEDQALEARRNLMEAIAGLKQGDITELKSIANPPQKVKTTCIWFFNFLRIDDNKEHTWMSIKKGMANPRHLLDTIAHFDVDSASGPQVQRVKNIELISVEELRKNSAAVAAIGNIMLRAQEYYIAKTSKA